MNKHRLQNLCKLRIRVLLYYHNQTVYTLLTQTRISPKISEEIMQQR